MYDHIDLGEMRVVEAERKVIEAARNRVDQIIESNTIIEGADVELVETVSALNKLLAAEGEE